MIYRISDVFKIGHGIHTEYKPAALIPFVEMSRQTKIGITTQMHLSKCVADQVETFVDPLGGIQMRRGIARAIDENPGRMLWNVTGSVTEYRGANYLAIEYAVLTAGKRAAGEGPDWQRSEPPE